MLLNVIFVCASCLLLHSIITSILCCVSLAQFPSARSMQRRSHFCLTSRSAPLRFIYLFLAFRFGRQAVCTLSSISEWAHLCLYETAFSPRHHPPIVFYLLLKLVLFLHPAPPFPSNSACCHPKTHNHTHTMFVCCRNQSVKWTLQQDGDSFFCRDVLLADLFVKRMFILDCAIAFLLEYMNRSSLVDFDTEIETLSSTQWPNSSKTLKYGLDAFHLFCSCKLIMSWLAGNVCASGSLQHFYTHTHSSICTLSKCILFFFYYSWQCHAIFVDKVQQMGTHSNALLYCIYKE